MVKRFMGIDRMVDGDATEEDDNGEYVKYDDYKILKDKYIALRIVNQDLYRQLRSTPSLHNFHDIDD